MTSFVEKCRSFRDLLQSHPDEYCPWIQYGIGPDDLLEVYEELNTVKIRDLDREDVIEALRFLNTDLQMKPSEIDWVAMCEGDLNTDDCKKLVDLGERLVHWEDVVRALLAVHNRGQGHA